MSYVYQSKLFKTYFISNQPINIYLYFCTMKVESYFSVVLSIIFAIILSNLSLLQLHGQPLYFHHLTVDNGLPHNMVNSLVEDKYGFMWIATMEGLCRFDGYKVTTYYSDNTKTSLINHRPIKLYRDSNDDIWIRFSTTTQVCKYNYQTDDFSRFELEELDMLLQNALSRDAIPRTTYHSASNHLMWNLSNNSLLQMDTKTLEKYIYQSNSSQEGALSDSYVLVIYLDSNDILWVGTDNGGVHYADVNRKAFNHYTYGVGNSIRTLCEDDEERLWIGTRNNGIIRMNRDRSFYSTFSYSHTNQDQIANNQIRKIYKDSKGIIWIGTRGGLYKYNSVTNKIKHFTTKTQSSVPHNWIYAINEDINGTLWIGTWNGIASYDSKTDSIITHKVDGINSVRGIAKGKNGGLWIATERGLIFLDYILNSGDITALKTTYYRYIKNSNSINNDFIYSIDVDEDGNVWIGTAKGLCMYDIQKSMFINFHDAEYISDSGIRGVICYKDDVWISYGKGLTKINRKTFAMRHYDKFDGLQNNEFSEDAYYKNETGELFFGGNNGLNTFFPDSIKDNPHPPKVVFTGLRIQNKPVVVNQEINGTVILKTPLLVTQSLEFNHKQKEFEIEFSALHYSNPSKNRYAYKLDGFDEEWIYLSSPRRSAIYSGLPAGKYTLQVKAANSDGVWSDQPVKMNIRILPPWWESWWAYIVYALLLLFVFLLINRIIFVRKNLKHRIQLEQVKAEKAEEISRIRSTFFTGISHELRTPVTLIIDPLRKLISGEDMNVAKTYDLMYRNALRLLNLINQLLDFRKVESAAQTLRLVQQDIVAFVRNAMAMFEYAAEKRNIALKLESKEECRMLAFDGNILDKILTNLISNALKYSPDNTQITVRLSEQEDQWLAIQIIDQGIGIAPEMKDKIFDLFFRVENNKKIGSGIGLALTKELVQLHEGYITVNSEQGKGSCFTVLLPISLQSTSLEYEREQEVISEEIVFEADRTDSVDESTDGDAESSDKPLLLIIEDNDDIRSYIKKSLSNDYSVASASNGKDGLRKALEIIPDLIVSDIMMPEMSGIELTEQLKTDERTSHIPVILLTARQSDEARMEGYETGADDYIIKPFNSVLLKIRIKNLIESRRKLRALFGSGTQIELKKISVNPADEKFINRAVDIVKQYISDSNFTPDIFAQEMAVSRAQLFRKIKAMTNQTVQEFITTIKLNRAAELLLTSDLQIGEISIDCGFSNASNFRRSFLKKFGVTPSEYKKSAL